MLSPQGKRKIQRPDDLATTTEGSISVTFLPTPSWKITPNPQLYHAEKMSYPDKGAHTGQLGRAIRIENGYTKA